MKQIPLTKGKVALVDDQDYEKLTRHRWKAKPARKGRPGWYAARNVWNGEKWATIFMHQEIMGLGSRWDHQDGDGLNNQRHNLRPATQVQNLRNRAKAQHQCTSRFKGVEWEPSSKRWRARIGINGRRKSLGRHLTQEAAARAYDSAAIEIFGEFARTNFHQHQTTK